MAGQQSERVATGNTTAAAPGISIPLDGSRAVAVEGTLAFGHKISLTLGNGELLVSDKTRVVPDRTCCSWVSAPSPPTRSIPYYNILWASLSDDSQTLAIDFAEVVSEVYVQPATLAYTVSGPFAAESAPDLAAIHAWIEVLLSHSYGGAARAKRAYVLVNPFAGPGGADKIWEKQARPLFEAARMPLTVVRTTRAGEAVDLAAQMDVEAFDIVIACSGDGLPHEVFNGLGRRPDARRALANLAVCHIPCGSGNAMACNVYGTHRPSLAALAIVKGVPTPLDLISITQGNKRTLSFLSQALGIVADLDLGTEHLRWMGPQRFTFGFLVLAMRRKVYPCDIAVKVEIENKEGVRKHYRNRVLGGGSDDENGADSVAAASEVAASSSDDGQGLPPLKYGTIMDKLPDGWELVPHEKLGNFYCGNMGYMTPDTNFFPAALPNDGLMDLVMIEGDVSLLQSIKMQLSVETGRFFDNPLVSYRKVSAYRIIPLAADGYISIDGERVPFEPFQAEVHRSLGLTLSKNGGFEAPGPRHWDRVAPAENLIA